MRVPIYQVDAFTSQLFRGNPAAVCPLEAWLDDGVLQDIAGENNLSETAFLLRRDGDYALRWFTPTVEVALCGHATLAAAYVVFHYLEPGRRSVTFQTRSGDLHVTCEGDLLALDFPTRPAVPCEPSECLLRGLVTPPEEVWRASDHMAVYADEETVRNLRPDFAALSRVGGRGIIVTAPGREADFVSRFFAPGAGIPEDPVTGSAHCTLIPYWAERLGKQTLHALQVSTRGGELFCELRDLRVRIAGRVVPYLEGTIRVA